MPNVDIFAIERHINVGWYEDCMEMSRRLKDVFVTHANCTEESVHIRFHPVAEKYYTVGGVLLDSDQDNSIFEINVAWYERTPEVQDAVALGLTAAVNQLTGIETGIEVNFKTLDPGSHYEGGKRAPSL